MGLLEPNGTSIIYPALFICRCLFEGEILITQCTELFYRADSWGQGSSPLIAGTKWFKQQPVLQTNPAPPLKSLEQFLITLLPSPALPAETAPAVLSPEAQSGTVPGER